MASTSVPCDPLSPSAEVAVRRALADVLSGPEFRASRKCQAFLTFVVEEALAGRQESLKERVIGAEVFSRAPGFETAGDSIVRVKATEVRRRLGRYYQERAEADVRIELPIGSYVPVFHLEEAATPTAAPAEPAAVMAQPQPKRLTTRRTALFAGAGGALAAGWRFWPRATPLELFWAPLIGSSLPIVVCASGGPAVTVRNGAVMEALRRPQAPGAAIRTEDLSLSRQAQTSWPTVQAIVDVTRVLSSAGKEFQVRVADEMSFEQVRNQPMVVIGMFSNPWTIELTRQLRFTFAVAADGVHLVKDALQPASPRMVEGLHPHSPMPIDYALVTRLLDPQQDRRIIAIGGISGLGTRVAANFATNPRNWEQFAAGAPLGWEQKNIQVLLETRIVGDTPSPPTIVATHVW